VHTTELHIGCKLTHRLDCECRLLLRIGLAQNNLHEIDSLVAVVPNPELPTYSPHWSPAAIASHFAPSQVSHNAVVARPHASGTALERVRLSLRSGWIAINVMVEEAEELLKVVYSV